MAALSQSDLRARYGRGPWRLIKWLIDPFALVGIYLLLVTLVREDIGPAPGLSLACAVIPFQLVMTTVVNAMDAVKLRRSILANMSFPRMFLPLASALTETIAFSASLLLLGLMMVVYGVTPSIHTLWLPVVIGVNLGFAAAAAYPATLIGLWLPDLRPFVVSLVRALFFLAPGLIALEQITGQANALVRINPLTGLFEAYRDVLLYGRAPATWELLWPLGFAALVLLAFLPIFRAEQRHFAKVVE
jgi:ABC-type polysaccharide/polyol phosphate export permease